MKQDTINALAVIQATEDAIESSYSAGDPYLFEEHFLKGLKNVGKKLKETVKKVGKKVVDAVKTVTKNALLGPLLLFKGAMVLALKKRGIDPPKKLPELVSKFYQTVLQKKDSYEYNFDIEEDLNNFDPVITPMIVSAIVKFIKGLLEKKAKGETLTPEEQELAGAVEKDTKMLTTEASAQEGLTDDEGNKKGGTGMNFNKMLPIILVAVVVLFALKK